MNIFIYNAAGKVIQTEQYQKIPFLGGGYEISVRVKYTYDATHIIKVHFMDENTYGQFVELVNMMAKDKHKRYLFFNDNFYILGEQPPDENMIQINRILL